MWRLDIILHCSTLYNLTQGLSTRLDGQQNPGILLFLPSQPWDYTGTSLHSELYVDAGGINSGPHACVTIPLQKEPPP